jgi:hypothetical protein
VPDTAEVSSCLTSDLGFGAQRVLQMILLWHCLWASVGPLWSPVGSWWRTVSAFGCKPGQLASFYHCGTMVPFVRQVYCKVSFISGVKHTAM